jgi:hypothetical protein
MRIQAGARGVYDSRTFIRRARFSLFRFPRLLAWGNFSDDVYDAVDALMHGIINEHGRNIAMF